MFSTLALWVACVATTPQYSGVTLRRAQTIEGAAPSSSLRFAFTSDDSFDYLGTPSAFYRFPSILDSPPQRMPAIAGRINTLAVNEGTLYVLREGEDTKGPAATTHTLLHSTDRGASFSPLDAALEECFGGYCRFLSATQIDFAPGRIFLNGGGNVLVSGDGAKSWQVLFPTTNKTKPQSQACPIVFGRIDRRVVIGGECPLDFGFLRTGDLRNDMLDWSVRPEYASTPPLENRNVHFVLQAPNGAIFAGAEGSLLKSCDAGTSFQYVIRYPLSGGTKYPYLMDFLAPSRYPGLLITSGFDKAHAPAPYLAWSADGGETWIDVSSIVPEGVVALLGESRDGRPLLVLQQGGRAIVEEIVALRTTKRRRAVR